MTRGTVSGGPQINKIILFVLLLGALPAWSQEENDGATWADYLEHLDLEVGYARATLLPLIWLDFSALTTLMDKEKAKPFFIGQDKAFSSMGTYFFQFWNADPNEMNLPALDLSLIYENHDDINYLHVIFSPFFAADQRAFFIHGETGVEYDGAKEWEFFRATGTVYAFGTMLGFESPELLEGFFQNYSGGPPPVESMHNGLGIVTAGTGFRGTLQFGNYGEWSMAFKFYFELGAFLPFSLTYGTGMDFRFDLKIVEDLNFYLETRLMKAAWEPAGMRVGVRYSFGSLVGLFHSEEVQEETAEPEQEEAVVPTRQPPPPPPAPGNRKKT